MGRRSTVAGALAALIAWLPLAAAPNTSKSLAAAIVSDGGTFKIELEPIPAPVPVNELFEVAVTVTSLRELGDPNPLWLDLRTTMPGHGHGMNTRARVEPLGDGRFAVRGLLLHMSGQWEFTFDVAKGRVHERATVRFEL